jgi:hypothetical protein
MQYLPSDSKIFNEHEKLKTYLFLSQIGCPVFKSVILDNDSFSPECIDNIIFYLGSEFCTIRYQYIRPNSNPIRGGNKFKIDYNILMDNLVPDTLLWLLEPIDRLKNNYGINMYFNRNIDILFLECVGKGFDVSDLNRGYVTPHQTISFDLPIEYGWNNEWWKYAKFNFSSNSDFEVSKKLRMEKLNSLGFKVDNSIFSNFYEPLSLMQIEKLIKYSEQIYSSLTNENDFVVSCSIDDNDKFVFWDIQTPAGKVKILGGK